MSKLIWLVMFAASIAVGRPALGDLNLSGQTSELLAKYLSAEQMIALERTLSAAGQQSLGPLQLLPDEEKLLAGPGQRVVIEPPRYSRGGTGTREAPFLRVIEDAIKQQPKTPVTLIVPAGWYEEANLEVPDGVWLMAQGEAVLVPPVGVESMKHDPRWIISLNSRSGLVGFELDGSRARTVTGVMVTDGSSGTIVARNHIHDVPYGYGVIGTGAEAAVILANRIENVGLSGVRTGSQWLVKSNVIQYAGIHRTTGGGGDDGIIAGARTRGTRVLNNLVIAAKRPKGRHAIATQSTEDTLIQGNLCILEGKIRGGIVLADGSHNNRVIGNVVIGVSLNGQRTRFGIHANGNENQLIGDVVIGTEWGLSTAAGRFADNTIIQNYAEVTDEGLRVVGTTNRVEGNRVVLRKDKPAKSRPRQ